MHVKKILFVLPLMLFGIVGCNSTNNNGSSSGDNKITDSPKESVTLSASNFSTYVAVNSSAAILNNSYNDVIYYSYFIGADYCKFVNCRVTYTYAMNGGTEGTDTFTVPLTLSGDGQANPFFARNQNRYTYYSLVVTGASGTVEVYR